MKTHQRIFNSTETTGPDSDRESLSGDWLGQEVLGSDDDINGANDDTERLEHAWPGEHF